MKKQYRIFSGVTEKVFSVEPHRPCQNKFAFLNEQKIKVILFVLSHFNFCLAVEKGYTYPFYFML